MDSNELNRALLGRLQEVCSYLLPNGKVAGNLYLVGGLNGNAGDSLKITLSGAAAGRFKDFADDSVKGATPLWLWASVRKCSFLDAIKEAKEWMGIKDEDYGIKRHAQKTFSKPEKGGVRLAESNTKVMDYLVGERRLNPIVVCNAKVCETDDGEEIVFPFIERDEETGKEVAVHRKYIKVDRPNGKKECRSTKGTKRCLFGKNLITPNSSELIISEGEIDALSWHSWGFQAVSVPNGVADFEWVELDWDWLERFEKIYVCMDMDEPGKVAAQEICKRLGLHRCYIVSLPHKDVNECLVAGMDAEAMEKTLAAAKAIELEEIKKPNDFTEEVVDYYTSDFSARGWTTPWWPRLPWRVRKAEFTILSGFSGHGKTLALNQLMIDLVSQGCRIMDASLEVKPGMTLYNMTRCALGKRKSSREEVEGCINWLNESMFFLDCIGTVSVNRLLHAMEYARKRHGIDIFVIDSLFKCGIASEDYGSQKDFVDKLTTFCNNTDSHVILVAHSRKTSNGNEYSIPTKSDISGSSDLANAAFNVIIWWRNKLKKQKMDEAMLCNPPNLIELEKRQKEPDGKVLLDKQRFGEGEETILPVWFSSETSQFHCEKDKKSYYFTKNQ